MSIVTLCPQCKTAFAIQAEHYSAADAWVRCGRCAHVFEVDQHLFEIDPPELEAPASPDEVAAFPAPVEVITMLIAAERPLLGFLCMLSNKFWSLV